MGNVTGLVPAQRGGNALARTPAHLPPAGYDPARLDGALQSYLAVCERNIRASESLGKRVEQALERFVQRELPTGPDAVLEAEQVTALFERLTKAGLNLVKATDELSRLRSFLAGGPDSRPDLTVKGEIELRAMVITAAKQLGMRVIVDASEE